MENKATVNGKYLMYKDKPLVREGDTICYGDFSEKCVLIFEIMSYNEVNGEKVTLSAAFVFGVSIISLVLEDLVGSNLILETVFRT